MYEREVDSVDDIMEMAQGNLKRIVAIRLKPGTDVLLGLEEACKRCGINNGVILSAIGSLKDPEALRSFLEAEEAKRAAEAAAAEAEGTEE